MVTIMKSKTKVYRPFTAQSQAHAKFSKNSHINHRKRSKKSSLSQGLSGKKLMIALMLGLIAYRISFPRENIVYQKKEPEVVFSPSFVQPQVVNPDVNNKESLIFIVNKKRPMDLAHVPQKLVTPKVNLRLDAGTEQMLLVDVAAAGVESLFSDAKKAGHDLVFSSGYRSSAYQKQLYDLYVNRDGPEVADRSSARAGYSEHQTGLAVDVNYATEQCSLDICFGDTPAGKWIAENSHLYGFIVRYQNGKTAITGYQYEPWHLRYVGVETATKIFQSGKTMEEYFGLPPAPTY
jgi:zinc D-Ala-D-Ala carboxypeptidase